MKLIIQRIREAEVKNTTKYEKVKKGIIVYLGISKDFTDEKLEKAVRRTLNARVFGDDYDDNFKRSIKDIEGDILVISNFTLFGDINKSNKPNFRKSMSANNAKEIYEKYLCELKKNYDENKIKSGFFQEHMEISTKIDGPITLILDI